ncbi:ComEC/Rec2 family competence protein [Agrococcus sp. Marseille-Q4369]|uniref:ComEC/Rec2 family competence protein n=1 Tax=Agrococcus sp. Marseille-Q4369 TaxID=2810513 RepID=UPI001B8CF5C6|nr:ComEC/Rec2 family competence protein [Agrococcus sp. Marseille-Q4369]QUW19055.1 ComEC/Rec2 family competence protein [Agrococcus sp. Marseille-Q4369]
MRDLRLALPVAIAWALLATLSPHPVVLVPAGIACAVVAAGGLLLAHVLARRSERAAALVRTVAVGAALACPLLAGADAAASSELERCDELVLLLLGEAAPTEVVVTACDGAGSARSATLLRAPDAPLAIGATAVGRCDAWLDGSRWLLACSSLDVGEPARWASWAGALRDGLLAASAQLPGMGGELLPGLTIGDERRVSATLRAAMLDSGLSHLTAVSGANCVIVVGAAFQAAAAVGARRPVRVAVAAAALAGFVVLVTPEPSVVRAGAMAAIALVAVVTGRRAGAVALLSLAVLLVLAVQPHLASSPGFALSALATCGLIVHGRPIAEALSRVLPMPIAALVAVPAAAQLWCLPVLVGLDASVSAVSVLANLLAGPAAPIVTVVGLAACLASPLAPAVAAGLAWVAWLPAAWIAQVAMVAQQLPAAQVPWPVAPWGALTASAMLAAVVVGHARGRIARGVAIATAVGLIAVGSAAWPSVRLGALADWSIAQCDVGQGSATLMRHGSATVLVDAGPEPSRIDGCLTTLGVRRIDLLVLTHFDVDHAGGASALLGRVGLLVHGPVDDRSEALVAELAAAGAATHEARRGDAWALGEMRVEALWPVADEEPGNDASVAVAIDAPGGGLELVVLGDLGAQAQSRLLRAGVPNASVVVVAHHGSADQLPALYRRIGAAVGLVGVGENDYGHPTDASLRLVREAGGQPLRTDEHGTIALAVDDDGVRVWSERVGGPP